ncbi:hypothetical protein CVT26_002397 [Gymnopilus dilepis]|uniref:Ribonucleoside-diphosphate reductase n=1 Tax=Gymnopilus dilepis TaxID=231916 RepID=A0A409Y3N8_9AGAR|nr:hypothetical protein CVT26_002397 [Gymnopilus dilepis]
MDLASPVIMANELDHLLASVAAKLSHIHPAYDRIAGRIAMGCIYKETPPLFSSSVRLMLHSQSIQFTTMYRESVSALLPYLDAEIVERNDFEFAYSDSVLLFRDVYLLRDGARLLERPQHLFMRLSVAINGTNLVAVRQTYIDLAKGLCTYDPSTMINAGTMLAQMIPHHSLPFFGQSTMDKFIKLTECSMISYGGGSIAIGASEFPAEGEVVDGRTSNGLRAITRVFDNIIHRVGKTPALSRGRITVFVEPWHSEIYCFLQDNTRTFFERQAHARGLYFALWIPDLFMSRIESGATWSLFRPGDVPGLASSWGENFTEKYEAYEKTGLAVRTVPAKELWDAIVNGLLKTGGPSIMFKDSVNAKSNLTHAGTLTFGGIAADTALTTSSKETGICCNGSVVLPAFVSEDGTFDYQLLHRTVQSITHDLNRILLINNYPSMPAAASYVSSRCIGVGVVGLAEVFIDLRIPYDSEKAIETGRFIMETIYHAALQTSCDLVDVYGVYPTFQGSPLSKGYLQFDLWKIKVSNDRYDWDELRHRVMKRGVVNAQLILLTDTTSSSRLTSFTEGFEPLPSTVLVKGFSLSSYVSLNARLVRDLQKLGLWNEDVRLKLLKFCGSMRSIPNIPADIRNIYKTVWELEEGFVLRHAVSRAPFVCQSQSITLYSSAPSEVWLSRSIFSAWKDGLKTGIYRLHGGRPPVPGSNSDDDVPME